MYSSTLNRQSILPREINFYSFPGAKAVATIKALEPFAVVCPPTLPL